MSGGGVGGDAAGRSVARRPPRPVGEPAPLPAEEPPPFLGSWRNVYLLVLAALGLVVIALAALRAWAS
jgi:hypothetical protein